jgi:hypothetical protein
MNDDDYDPEDDESLDDVAATDPRVAAVLAAAAARRASHVRLAAPSGAMIPIGLRTQAVLPGVVVETSARLPLGAQPADLDVARVCQHEWLIRAIRFDGVNQLADDVGVPADAFSPEALHPFLCVPEGALEMRLVVERLRVPRPPWWQRWVVRPLFRSYRPWWRRLLRALRVRQPPPDPLPGPQPFIAYLWVHPASDRGPCL